MKKGELKKGELEKIKIQLNKAISLIGCIEEKHKSRFLSFFCYDAPLIPTVAYRLNKILRRMGDIDHLDVLIESGGGDIDTSAQIANLLHNRCKKFTAIVAFYAKSAATLLALKADELMFCKSGELGPVDPQVRHPAARIWIPAHSIEDALRFIEGTKDPIVKLSLADKLDPLLIGAYNDAREASKQYVAEIFEECPEDIKVKAVDIFSGGKIRSHGYPITREVCEKRGIANKKGLNIVKINEELENKICDLHEIYYDLMLDLGVRSALIFQTTNIYDVEINEENITSKLGVLDIDKEKIDTKK